MPEILYSSIFGALTQHVQARFDAASKLHKQLFDNVIFERFLDWDTPTIGLDFEEIIGQYNITVAAPTIGDQSKEAILGTEGLETVKERILNHAVTLPMTIQDYRKVLQILDSKSLPDKAKTEQLIKLMWGSSTTVVSSVLAKLDILFLRPLSERGYRRTRRQHQPRRWRARHDQLQPARREYRVVQNPVDGCQSRHGGLLRGRAGHHRRRTGQNRIRQNPLRSVAHLLHVPQQEDQADDLGNRRNLRRSCN